METKRKNNPFIKVVYYPGKLLHASDFECEQKFANEKLEFINRSFYGYGIIEGLGVKLGQNGAVVLEAGSAIDPQGRIIIVPSETILHVNDIGNLGNIKEKDFILGISYDEKIVAKETYLLGDKKQDHEARKREDYALKAYGPEEWPEQKRRLFKDDNLTQDYVIYEDEIVRLILEAPRIVPSNSIFRVRIKQQIAAGENVSIGWHGMARLQGARFAATGHSHHELHAREMFLEGNVQQEWDVYTEEDRQFPILFELERFEVYKDNKKQGHADSFGFSIDTSNDYQRSLQKLFRERQAVTQPENWLPLAQFEIIRSQDSDINLKLIEQSSVRVFAANPLEDAFCKEIEKQHGIMEIPLRRTLHDRPVQPMRREGQPSSTTDISAQDALHLREERREWYKKLLIEEREDRCNRGVSVIPIPRHYKRGQVLFSEVIFHGFPGEEVFLWCGRVWEEHNYAYRDRETTKYIITHGDEALFFDIEGNGWMIHEQAIRQDVDAGTFRIALTLKKSRRRKLYMEKEVAVSWIAIRTT